MARMRHPPKQYQKSPARSQRVTRGRNAKNSRGFVSPSKHKKGPVLEKESLVRTKLQKQLVNKAIATPLTDSDDSDGLVTRTGTGTVQKPIYASGGVALGDIPGAHPSRKRKSMDGDSEDVTPEKRRQIGIGSGLRRPAKLSLRSPLAPAPPNAIFSSPPKPTTSPTAAAPLMSSVVRPNGNISLLGQGETSILGNLKPRKRQPSILQIIGTNDSSHLTADDENEFLPDDESTPLPVSKATAAVDTPGSSLQPTNDDTISSHGLRRPTPASMMQTPSDIPGAVDVLSLSSPPASHELPASIVPQQKTPRQKTPRVGEDSILAPPISSSPDAASAQSYNTTKNAAPVKSKRQPARTSAPSVQPTQSRPRRQVKQKSARPTTEFDIPSDSAGSDTHSTNQIDRYSDNSPFKTKSSRRKVPPRTRRGTSVLSNISTNSKIGKTMSKNAQGARRGGVSQKEKVGGGARHLNTISGARGRGRGKENDSGDVDDGEGEEELERQRRMFEEVDGWEMEFEDVVVEEEGISQVGYR